MTRLILLAVALLPCTAYAVLLIAHARSRQECGDGDGLPEAVPAGLGCGSVARMTRCRPR